MRRIPRRLYLSAAASAAAALPIVGRARLEAAQDTDHVFRHGVASGDPLNDRVILWTRVTSSGRATAPGGRRGGRSRVRRIPGTGPAPAEAPGVVVMACRAQGRWCTHHPTGER